MTDEARELTDPNDSAKSRCLTLPEHNIRQVDEPATAFGANTTLGAGTS